MTNNCIYNFSECQGTTGSKEHTILQAFGGVRVSTNICCKKCNVKLGHDIDTPFTKRFDNLCALIGVRRDRKNDKPKKIVGVYNEDGVFYDLVQGGLVAGKYPPAKFEEMDDKLEIIEIMADKKERALELLDEVMCAKKRENYTIGNIEVNEVKIDLVFKDKWDFNFQLNDFRSVAKSILTELSKHISKERLRSGIFSNVISFISGTNNNHREFLRPIIKSNLPFRSVLGDYQTTLYIRFINGVGCLGILNLFDTFTFGVILSKEWPGEDILVVHMLDPQDGRVENKKFDKSNISSHGLKDWQCWLLSEQELKAWEACPLFFKREDIDKFLKLAKSKQRPSS